MDNTAAINALRQTKVFRNTSFRLLADLVEKADADLGCGSRRNRVDAALLLVLEGEVAIADRTNQTRLTARHAYWPEEPNFVSRRRDVAPTNGARYLGLTRQFLKDAHQASFSLFSSLDLRGWKAYETYSKTRPIPLHLMWVCEADGLGTPLEAMTHLLAASVAREFAEPAGILCAREDGVELCLWRKDRFVPIDFAKREITGRGLAEVIQKASGAPLCHLFFVNPAAPAHIPARLTGLRFHRIVYVTDQVPAEIPASLEERIVPQARNPRNRSAPYFSSFVASVLKKEKGNGRFVKQPANPGADDFSKLISRDVTNGGNPKDAARRRIDRDLCRIPFPMADLRTRWKERGGPRFANDLLEEKSPPGAEERTFSTIASRWARAITNRRVGLAVSGGGATSFRMVALLEMLAKRRVPIDVLGGLSGSVLVGAYYCGKGAAGLKTCVENGPQFQRLVLRSIVDSEPFSRKIDQDLDGMRVEDVDVRLLPVVTALPDGSPEAHVISTGTLGEAVRASGAAAGLASPVERRNGSKKLVRYADGVSSRIIPARAVADSGADLVIAFNTVPAPARRNPFERWPLGKLAYDFKPTSRLIDLAVSFLFLLKQVSDEAKEDAHIFIEPTKQADPILEAVRFSRAAEVVAAAHHDVRIRGGADACSERWGEFRASLAVPACWGNGAGRKSKRKSI